MYIITEAWKLVALTAISCSAVFFFSWSCWQQWQRCTET